MIARLAWIRRLIADRARYRMALEVIGMSSYANKDDLKNFAKVALNNEDNE